MSEDSLKEKVTQLLDEARARGEPLDLRGLNLSDANLRNANLRFANLKGADLTGVYLIWPTLPGPT